MKVLSASDFKRLPPKERGYVVYMFGARKDQPNVPNEKNPFPEGSKKHAEWNEGQRIAVLEAQDCEE